MATASATRALSGTRQQGAFDRAIDPVRIDGGDAAD